MIQKALFSLVMLMSIVLSASCSPNQASPSSEPNMPNPASVYCKQNGGKLELRQDASGGAVGICILPDGTECDEWAFFRNQCNSGHPLPTSVTATLPEVTEPSRTATTEVADDGWKIYSSDEFGYSFHYPADANIVVNDDPLRGLSITGPLVGNEYWPQITISHPRDRQDYRPPEGADLLQWLIDHHLLSEGRMPDVQIARTIAIHLRHDRSPQSYAFDRYYFARSGQLYMVVIGHVGDKEDWNLYNHFLQSIQFEK